MINRIKVLPVWLANKIAAGEVIERPSSCVKELIENALDAGATDIKVTIKEGGKKLIRVVDNGNGIISDDLPLVFKSHSTSKIVNEPDLYDIKTFGFRGEALASIAAIAQVRLISKTPEQQESYEITIKDDKITTPQPVAGVNGTTVEVANLFYQTPARRNFLKSDSVELYHIREIISRFAIAYPESSFSLINLPARSDDTPALGQVLLNLPAMPDNSPANILQRLTSFYETDISKELTYVNEEKDGIKIDAYFSLPTYTRPTSKYQFFYLNRRFIRDRIISRAIYQSYHNLIPDRRYPFVLLFIQMPPTAFDVNVHPTKIEVRFHSAWKLHDQIISLIRGHLAQKVPLTQPISQEAPVADTADTQPEGQRVMQALVDFFIARGDSAPPRNNPDLQVRPEDKSGSLSEGSGHGRDGVYPAHQCIGVGVYPASSGAAAPPRNNRDSAAAPQSTASISNLLGFHKCFQIHNSYIVEEISDGILIIDQHALHERILYNRLSKQIASSEIYKQRLLIPTVVEIPKPKMTLLGEIIPHLKAVGIEVEEFGENAIAVQSAPSILNNVNLNDFIIEFIDAFADDFPDAGKEKDGLRENIKPTDNLIKLMACKSAIKAGDPLTQEEIKALISASDGIDWTTCPHGRPAIRKITLSELEGYFQR